MSQVPVQTRVPEDVAAALREQARRDDRSVASIVRLALIELVKRQRRESA